jgi:hypothetical protein
VHPRLKGVFLRQKTFLRQGKKEAKRTKETSGVHVRGQEVTFA